MATGHRERWPDDGRKAKSSWSRVAVPLLQVEPRAKGRLMRRRERTASMLIRANDGFLLEMIGREKCGRFARKG